MTKEEILDKLQKENPHSIPVFKAMDEYAKQQAIAFAIHYAKGAIMNGVHEDDVANDRMDVRYDHFIESQTPPKHLQIFTLNLKSI